MIPPPLVEQIQQQAFSAYPAECCGLLFARGEHDVTRVVPMENLQDRLHALDPEAHPRTSKDGFHMDACVCGGMLRRPNIVASDSWPSITVISTATRTSVRRIGTWLPLRPAGVPTYPDVWHVIVACWPDGLREARACQWDGRDFVGHAIRGFTRTATLPAAR